MNSRSLATLFFLIILSGILILSIKRIPESDLPQGNYPESNISIELVVSKPAISLHASYAALVDPQAGRLLYGKASDQKVPMASTTKIMTLLIALEHGDFDKPVSVSKYAASMPKVHLGMTTSDQFLLKDLLYSLMLESHNDSAVAIAEHVAGSVENFARLMNEKAKSLYMNSTNFVTPNGLDDDDHYSTAYDMCLLAGAALADPNAMEIIQTKQYAFSNVAGSRSFTVHNKDAFLSYYDGALGMKTGFTGKAGYCFVGAASRNNRLLTTCVLACGWPPNKSWKWSDTSTLMNFGFDHYEEKELPMQDLSQCFIPVYHGTQPTVSCFAKAPISSLISNYDSIRVSYDIPKILEAPIEPSVPIGSISYYINDKLFQTLKIFPTQRIEKSTISDTIGMVLQFWMKPF